MYLDKSPADACCVERMDRMVRRMADAEGATEDLKARDQKAWVARMNNIRHRAEESILAELVFD